METRIEIDINAHSPTNDEMCKIITGKNISDFALNSRAKKRKQHKKNGSQADTNRPNGSPP